MDEVIITDEKTGGKKGSKLARFSLIPAEFLWALAEHYGLGAKKYDDRNWERGYKWSLSIDALERHLSLWKQGETTDPETGSSHLIAVAWHACALFIFQLRGLGTNDMQIEKEKATNPEGQVASDVQRVLGETLTNGLGQTLRKDGTWK